MRTDIQLAVNISKLISSRSPKKGHISISCQVLGGVRHITFISMSNDDFTDSYSLLERIADITNTDKRKETWANPHFLGMWESVKARVMSEISQKESLPIVLSGHGVGGAVALIAGYYLTMKGKNLTRVVTFGSPGSLNYRKAHNSFVDQLQRVSEQYTMKRDKMPNLFRFTKYFSAKRTELNVAGIPSLTQTLDDYIESLVYFSALHA